MSRALDKGVKDALKHADHGRIFADIAGVLTEPLDDLLEIELLGSSHVLGGGQTFMRDGYAIAIPKIHLVQGFLAAYKIYRQMVEGREFPDDTALKVSAVMLLMDPEHLTAANMRKRLLERTIRKQQGDAATSLLQRERLFTDSLLTSRLHRHTKSPNLWNHRRWLMQQWRRLEIALDVVDHFHKVIFVSGERHPRNYYAWCHARYLVGTTEDEPEAAERTRAALLPSIKTWCLAHHDDVSGWMFLQFLHAEREEAVAIVGEILRLAEAFHWRNESVWYFIKNMLTLPRVAEAHGQEAVRVKEALLQGVETDSKEAKALNQVG